MLIHSFVYKFSVIKKSVVFHRAKIVLKFTLHVSRSPWYGKVARLSRFLMLFRAVRIMAYKK